MRANISYALMYGFLALALSLTFGVVNNAVPSGRGYELFMVAFALRVVGFSCLLVGCHDICTLVRRGRDAG